MEQQVQLLSIKKEEEEEADITDFPLAAAAVKSENEEKVHSLFHHVKNEYKDEEEPQTSSSGKKKTMKLHQHFFSVRNQVLYFVCFCCGFVSFTSVMLLLKYGGYFFRARFKNK